MKVFVAATQNQHKIEEISAITRSLGIEVISRDEAGAGDFETEEDGETFEANSEKKAREVMEACGLPAIADDSGLMVDALDGRPGVYSARFAGENAGDRENNEKLLALLAQVPAGARQARFVSVVTLIYPDGEKIAVRGECPGRILDAPRGSGGFGYDPLFVPEGFEKSFGELTPEEKNKISHRARALAALAEALKKKELPPEDAG
ncbi:MAG: RdgB/HAM1 family non-canonical purine NTP pyrophosphatase [Bacillota bacterium]|nr:RdgB/HAM1 family non-canonical purine NTP pyrophosphatase [Bacillota bacterium]